MSPFTSGNGLMNMGGGGGGGGGNESDLSPHANIFSGVTGAGNGWPTSSTGRRGTEG